MNVVVVPVEAWGKFYSGDAYIIFSSSLSGESGGVKVKPGVHGRVEQHLHFWLGENASQDEAAVAAYKTVELDEHLGGYPVQHREVQGQESSRFISYFKTGVRYLNGGVKSGLSHYVEDVSPKLFQVKGKRKPLILQTRTIGWSEINHGDSYVLDVPEVNVVFVWQGNVSNRYEKLQAAKFAQTLKEEHGDPGYEIVVLEDGNEGSESEQGEIFNQLLPLSAKAEIKDAGSAPDQADGQTRGRIKLYRCSDSEGKLVLTEVKDGPLFQEDLKSEDSFLVDNGNYGIWVWIGKRASEGERREAMRNAQGFIKAKNLKSGTPVTRVIDGGEPAEFKSLFQQWKDKDQTTNLGRKVSTSGLGKGIARTVQTRFDAETLHENPRIAATNGMVDDGTGVKEVYRVEMFDLVAVPEKNHGIFFSGDCYVILYAYNDGKKDHYIIYYWMGSHSSQDEQGAAALRTVELDDRLNGLPVQIRVVQGKEPQHFLAMFAGQMRVFNGGKASAFDGEFGVDRGIPANYLLQVRGSNRFSTKATEEELRAASLNTNDCFLLVQEREVTVWFGKGSTGDEREMAKILALSMSDDPNIIFEGQEKSDFWSSLGGKESYFDEKISKQGTNIEEPRLFQCSNASGNVRVEEIHEFEQMDLLEEDVMILDAGHSIFLWFGLSSNRTEQHESTRIAREYLETCPIERDVDTPVIVVKQGREPISFTGYFGSWDEEFWGDVDELYSNLTPTADVYTNGNNAGYNGYGSGVYPYSVLSGSECPETIDPSRKEDYLSDTEFVQVFGLDREEFSALPNWKKTNLKKAKNMF